MLRYKAVEFPLPKLEELAAEAELEAELEEEGEEAEEKATTGA